MHRSRLVFAPLLIGVLALIAAACGSSSHTGSSTTSKSKGGGSDTVTAINELTGVGTTLDLDPTTAAALTHLGVKLSPYGSAKATATSVTFPITSGYVEIHSDRSVKPGYIIGSIQHFGSGLTLSAGSKKLTVKNFVVDPGNSVLYATVGAMQAVPLLSLDGTKVQVSMSGGDVVLNGTIAKLTAVAAKAIDTTFGTTAVQAGLPLGTAHIVASGVANTYNGATTEISRVTGQSTSLSLDANTVKALTGLGVKFAPYGSATFTTATSEIHFPITGGVAVIHADKAYKPGYIAGVLIHQGSGFTLSKGGVTVVISDFVVNPGNSILTGTVDGKIGIPLLTLNGSKVVVSTPDGTVHLDGTVASLTPVAADALDSAFKTTAIKAGTPLGIAHIIAAGTARSLAG